MKFKATFYDPFNPHVIELGEISKDSIIAEFERVAWSDFIQKIQLAAADDINWAPCLEIMNTETKHGLEISAVGEPGKYEFDVTYKRPKVKVVKSFFGRSERLDESYMSDLTGHTKENVIEYLNALIKNETEFLENNTVQE